MGIFVYFRDNFNFGRKLLELLPSKMEVNEGLTTLKINMK